MRPPTRSGRSAATKAVAAAAAATALVATMATSAHATPGADPTPEAPKTDAGATTAGTAPRTPALDDGRTTITLVTGDVIDVTATDDGVLTLGFDSAGGAIETQQVGDHLYTIPTAAKPYLAAGTVDRRLFDVTGLLEMSYDDETVDATPLILEQTSTRAKAAKLPGAERTLDLPSIDADAVAVSKKKSSAFWSAVAATDGGASARAAGPAGKLGGGVEKIWLDGKAETTLDRSTAQIGAPEAWAAGFEGKGATVAVLDTGIDATHPDVADQVDEAQSFVPG
ncbi:hypothetical protein OH802_20130 [Nocardioides sp. NBC_00850]|uniref:hypothetical protein n=1 Tax=Nocardioides sp. NBC_00850 TaxID=2976001 RepID=UPI00386869B1|nr:hypothetical protein OH802_20130 [Nocardioides sp. NBC_00850]